jgi:hypothetical protein
MWVLNVMSTRSYVIFSMNKKIALILTKKDNNIKLHYFQLNNLTHQIPDFTRQEGTQGTWNLENQISALGHSLHFPVLNSCSPCWRWEVVSLGHCSPDTIWGRRRLHWTWLMDWFRYSVLSHIVSVFQGAQSQGSLSTFANLTKDLVLCIPKMEKNVSHFSGVEKSRNKVIEDLLSVQGWIPASSLSIFHVFTWH